MPMTPSKLKRNLYALPDCVLESGIPAEIIRKEKILKIVPPAQVSKFACLKKRDCIVGDPEDLVSFDWSKV